MAELADDQPAANLRIEWARVAAALVFASTAAGLAATGWPVEVGESLDFSSGPQLVAAVLFGFLFLGILGFQLLSGLLPEVRAAMDEYHRKMRLRPIPPRSVLRLQYGPGPPGVTRRPRTIATLLIAAGVLGLAVFLLRMLFGW